MIHTLNIKNKQRTQLRTNYEQKKEPIDRKNEHGGREKEKENSEAANDIIPARR